MLFAVCYRVKYVFENNTSLHKINYYWTKNLLELEFLQNFFSLVVWQKRKNQTTNIEVLVLLLILKIYGKMNVSNHNNENIVMSPEVNRKWRKTERIFLLYDILYIQFVWLLRKTTQVEHVTFRWKLKWQWTEWRNCIVRPETKKRLKWSQLWKLYMEN